MKYYCRLVTATFLGVVLIAVLTVAVYWARSALDSAGYAVSDRVFLIVLLAALGGGFGFASQSITRLAKRDRSSTKPHEP